MPTVRITVAVFRWTTEAGTRSLATHGQQIELPGEIVERSKHLDVFEVLSETSDDTAAVSALADTSELPDKPAYAATKGVWVEYSDALHRHTGGQTGLTASDAVQLSRRELIAALATPEAPATQQDTDAQNYQTPTPTAPELAQLIPPLDPESFEDDHVERTRQ